jgi:primosomal replication protein N
LRYTPAGVEALDLRVGHASTQASPGGSQRIELELQCVAFADMARRLQHVQAGQVLHLVGFLMPSRRGARVLKLNIIDWIQEGDHGLLQENRP